MQGKKPNGCNFMRVIEWNEIWEFRVLHECDKNLASTQNMIICLAASMHHQATHVKTTKFLGFRQAMRVVFCSRKMLFFVFSRSRYRRALVLYRQTPGSSLLGARRHKFF